MLTRQFQSPSWSACSVTAYSHPFMPRPSMIAVKKTPGSRPWRKPLPRRPKLPLTFHLGSEKWMLAIFKAIDFPLRRINAPKRRFPIRTLSGLKSLNASLLNTPKTSRPRTGFRRTIRTIGAIKEIVVIVAFTAQDLQAPPQPLESTEPILWLRMTKTATGHQSEKTNTRLKSPVTIVIKKRILLTRA